jgi:hypothetical protein
MLWNFECTCEVGSWGYLALRISLHESTTAHDFRSLLFEHEWKATLASRFSLCYHTLSRYVHFL